MTAQIGTMLWEMRTAGGWTVGGLAKQAGIDKSALSRWENGKRLPRGPELETVLDALHATPSQRALLFSCIEAPRAIRHLKQAVAAIGLTAPPMAGDLFRAMRLRREWTQERLATCLKVSRTAISQWEQGARLPAAAQIQALCYALNAQEPELIALTTGRFAETPELQPETWEEKEIALTHQLDSATPSSGTDGLEELRFLLLERDAWAWAARVPAARARAGRICMYHGEYHSVMRRWEMCRPLEKKATVLMSSSAEVLPDQFRTAILGAVITAYGGFHPTPERGLSLLKKWVGRKDAPAAHAAWMLSEIAGYLMKMGQVEESLRLAEQACRMAKRCPNPLELQHRYLQYAERFLEAGRPEEAGVVLSEVRDPVLQVGALTLTAEAYLQTGNASAAGDSLRQAARLIEEQDDFYWRKQIEILLQKF